MVAPSRFLLWSSIAIAAFFSKAFGIYVIHEYIQLDIQNITQMVGAVTVPKGSDPSATIWTVTGFTGGGMGLQVDENGERFLFFNIFGAGICDVVDTVEAGEGVDTGPYTYEQSGTQATLKYDWKTDKPVYFKMKAELKDTTKDKAGTQYSGYYSLDEGKSWNLLATLFANNYLSYMDSTSELFGMLRSYGSQDDLREGLFTNGTAVSANGENRILDHVYFNHAEKGHPYAQYRNIYGDNTIFYQRLDGSLQTGLYTPNCLP